jgi:predicted nucleotidyltransferase
MGKNRTETTPGGLAAALFTPVQGRALALLFGQPARDFGSSELIRQAGAGTGAAHRQLQRLERVGLVRVTRVGNQKRYQANPDSPIFPELHGLVVKTVGMVEPLRAALAPLAAKIELAFVFGSVAKGSERANSDVDLMIVGDELGYVEIYEALQEAEKALGRAVNPTVMTRAEWLRKRDGGDSFARRVAAQPRLFVVGSEDAVA